MGTGENIVSETHIVPLVPGTPASAQAIPSSRVSPMGCVPSGLSLGQGIETAALPFLEGAAHPAFRTGVVRRARRGSQGLLRIRLLQKQAVKAVRHSLVRAVLFAIS